MAAVRSRTPSQRSTGSWRVGAQTNRKKHEFCQTLSSINLISLRKLHQLLYAKLLEAETTEYWSKIICRSSSQLCRCFFGYCGSFDERKFRFQTRRLFFVRNAYSDAINLQVNGSKVCVFLKITLVTQFSEFNHSRWWLSCSRLSL